MALFRCGSGSGGGGADIHSETFASLGSGVTKTYTASGTPKFVYFCGAVSGKIYSAVYDENVSTTQFKYRYYHSSSSNNLVGAMANFGTASTYPPSIDISGNTVTVKTGTNSSTASYDFVVVC